MGAVVSCISNMFAAIGRGIMAVITAIGAAIKAIINAIIDLFAILISCLTCGKAGRSKAGGSHV
ncbi:hypothetical protein K431DRAFT_302792 [Polychaeton citri CBS 116435]|uniref:Uncharacterized protein n=1 Tax=Polychaeton citri CBS 116435 TaxID=1314669 RepID=A0A9P4QAH6_9PEZI|nr:hypothetical protein K431DRAFT_302792 [Polychaeton citri CBS 116435]